MRILILLAGALCACASFSYLSPGPYFGGALVGAGTYLAEAMVEPTEGEPYRISWIFQRKREGVFASAFAPTGQVFLRVIDSLRLGGDPEWKIAASVSPVQREQLIFLYQGLRALLILDDKPALLLPSVKERYEDRRPKLLESASGVLTEISEYDWEGHAFRVKCRGPTFSSSLTLREYKTEPI